MQIKFKIEFLKPNIETKLVHLELNHQTFNLG